MADPRSMTLDGLLSRIDRAVRHHEQLSEWAAPVSDGPIYPQQVERARLARCDMVPDWENGDVVISLPTVGAGSTLVNQIRQAGVRAFSFGFRGVDHG